MHAQKGAVISCLISTMSQVVDIYYIINMFIFYDDLYGLFLCKVTCNLVL